MGAISRVAGVLRRGIALLWVTERVALRHCLLAVLCIQSKQPSIIKDINKLVLFSHWLPLHDHLIRVTLLTIRLERALRLLNAIWRRNRIVLTRSLEMLRICEGYMLEFRGRLWSTDDLLRVKDIVLVTTSWIIGDTVPLRQAVPFSVVYDELELTADLDFNIGLKTVKERIVGAIDPMRPRNRREVTENLYLEVWGGELQRIVLIVNGCREQAVFQISICSSSLHIFSQYPLDLCELVSQLLSSCSPHEEIYPQRLRDLGSCLQFLAVYSPFVESARCQRAVLRVARGPLSRCLQSLFWLATLRWNRALMCLVWQETVPRAAPGCLEAGYDLLSDLLLLRHALLGQWQLLIRRRLLLIGLDEVAALGWPFLWNESKFSCLLHDYYICNSIKIYIYWYLRTEGVPDQQSVNQVN